MLIYIKAYFKRNLRYIESYTIYILITFQKSMLFIHKNEKQEIWMSLLHIGETEYEEGYTGIRKDTSSQPSVQRHCIPHAVLRERESLIPVQSSDRKPLSE